MRGLPFLINQNTIAPRGGGAIGVKIIEVKLCQVIFLCYNIPQ